MNKLLYATVVAGFLSSSALAKESEVKFQSPFVGKDYENCLAQNLDRLNIHLRQATHMIHADRDRLKGVAELRFRQLCSTNPDFKAF